MRIFLFLFILSKTVNTYGQIDLNTQITLEVEKIYLEDLFKTLEQEYGIVVAYGSDNIPSELNVTIRARVTTLYEIIQIVCTTANVSYQIIDDVIVFKYLGKRSPQEVIDKNSLPDTREIKNPSRSTATPHISGQNNDSISTEARVPPIMFPRLKLPFRFDPQKVKLPELKAFPASSAAISRERNKKSLHLQTGLFFSYSGDFNHFHFTERDIAFQKYRTQWNESFGLGGYVILTPRIYISLGLGYSTKDFSLEYNYMVLDPDDPFPIPDKTLVELRYLEIPLTIGYDIYSRRQYSLWVATAFFPSFLVDEDENTAYKNQSNQNTDYFLSANRSTFYSGAIGFIFHGSISPSWGLFLNPSLVYALGSVNEKAIQPNFALYRVNAGVLLVLLNKN